MFSNNDSPMQISQLESLADLSWILPPVNQNCNDLGRTQNGKKLKYPELYLAHRDAHDALSARRNIGNVSFAQLLKKCCYVRDFKENIHILYIKLKEIKFPIQILLPSKYLLILFQTK